MTDAHAWLLTWLTVGFVLSLAGTVSLWWRLIQAHKLLAAESARLDWLDSRCSPVVEGQTYSWPYGEHVAKAWAVEWPASTVREAIDAYRAHTNEE